MGNESSPTLPVSFLFKENFWKMERRTPLGCYFNGQHLSHFLHHLQQHLRTTSGVCVCVKRSAALKLIGSLRTGRSIVSVPARRSAPFSLDPKTNEKWLFPHAVFKIWRHFQNSIKSLLKVYLTGKSPRWDLEKNTTTWHIKVRRPAFDCHVTLLTNGNKILEAYLPFEGRLIIPVGTQVNE